MSRITENKAFKLFSDIFSAIAFMSNEVGEDSYSEKLPENLKQINSGIDKRSEVLNVADISLDSDEEASNVTSGGSTYSEPKEVKNVKEIEKIEAPQVVQKSKITSIEDILNQTEIIEKPTKKEERKVYQDEGIESILQSLEKHQKERDD